MVDFKLRHFAWLAPGIAGALTPIAPSVSRAQTIDNQPPAVEEIVVTANRREERLQKVPISVTAFSADKLTAQGIQALTEIQPGAVPSVIFQPFGGQTSSAEISIRGVSTNDPEQGTRELPVPVYIDGVYLGRAQGSGLDLIDPERVEVLRGPQGTLFGRNAEGGAVQYVSRKPSGQFDGDITASLGDYDYHRIRGVIDLPDISGFKIQVAGLYSERDGFTRNAPAGALPTGASVLGNTLEQADFSARDGSGARVAMRWDAVDRLTVDYAYDWAQMAESQAYLTYTGTPVPNAGAPTTSFPAQSSAPLYNAPFITTTHGHALTATYDATDAITLKSISSYREASKTGYANLGTTLNLAPAFGLPPSAAPFYSVADQNLQQHQFSEEAQMLGTWDRLTLTTGAVYYTESINQSARPSFFSGPGLALFGLSDFLPGARTSQTSKTESLGLYAQGTYTPPVLDDRLELTVGLRYSHDRKNALRYRGPADPANPFDPAEMPLDIHARFAADRRDPAFTVKYNISDDVNVYARYARAYRAGGVSIRSVNFEPYQAEETREIEVGFKARTPEKNLTLNGAFYQNTIHNPQFDVGESPVLTQTTRTINAPIVVTVRGIELEATYVTPVPGLRLGLNYAYMDVDQPAYINPTGSPPGLINTQVLFAPRNSGSLNIDYDVPVSVGDLVWHADYEYSSKFFVGGEIDPLDAPPSPTRPVTVQQLNARVSLEHVQVQGTEVSLAIWVKNLLDRQDFIYTFRLPGDNVHSYNYFDDPRTFGVDMRVKF